MTIPYYKALKDQWRICPPPQLLMSWYWGYKPKRSEDRVTSKQLLEMMKNMRSKSVRVPETPGDIAQLIEGTK